MADRQVPDPIIVYGAPRSGTTYLEQILNAHPEFFISHETRIFGWLNQAVAVLPNDDRFVLNERRAFVERLRAELPPVIRAFYRNLAPEVRYWGDKNPHYAARYNAGSLDVVAELFPRSRFVHIVRDGRDVVSSLLRKRDEDGRPWVKNFEQAHQVWTVHVENGSSFGRKLPSNRYFEIRYEDLVADDVAMARELFGFLGLELHPAVEGFCRDQRDYRTPFMGPTRDLSKGVAGSDWETVLNRDQQRRSLELLGPQLVHYGYETELSLAKAADALVDALDRGPSAPG
jgi:hypothetical protein